MKPLPTFSEVLAKLRERPPLNPAEMSAGMQAIMSGTANEAEIEEFLLLFREKGETAEELAAAAKVMREHALRLPKAVAGLLDTCGTGGDNQKTLNVSTLSALLAAAAGVPVAKHGNRSVSSVCGSADLLEKLGIRVDLKPEEVFACLEKNSFGFFFAPTFHPAVRHAMTARKKIKGKTLFNLLGPLSNPAAAEYQLLGVYDEALVEKMAKVLAKLGLKRAMVVYGKDGLDEISLSGETRIAELKDGKILTYTVAPEDFNLKREPLDNLRCQTAEDAEAAARKVLKGDAGAATKMVCLNAAAALYIVGKVRSIKEGVLMALDTVERGALERKCKAVASFTQRLQ